MGGQERVRLNAASCRVLGIDSEVMWSCSHILNGLQDDLELRGSHSLVEPALSGSYSEAGQISRRHCERCIQ